jgi:hypothetical protein
MAVQPPIDLGATWLLALRSLGRRPLLALLLTAVIMLAAYAAAWAGALFPGIAVTSPFLLPYFHLVTIVRGGAVAAFAALSALPLLTAAGLAPDGHQGRSLGSFIARIVVAAYMTIGLTELFVPPTDLTIAAVNVGDGSYAVSLFIELVGLIFLHAGLAAASLVGVPDALLDRRRKRAPNEGPHLFVACLFPFGVAAAAEVTVGLFAGRTMTMLHVQWIAFAFDAEAMFLAVLIAFANCRRFAPAAPAERVARIFD